MPPPAGPPARPAAPPYLVDADGPSVVALRRHAEADVPRVLEQCLDPLVRQWTTVPVPYSLEHAQQFVREAMPGGWESDREWAFAIDVDGRYGGTVSLRDEGDDRAEVAYAAHPDVRGTGAVERALRLLLAWGFEERGLRTVVWWADRGNWASRRVAWRLGFDVSPGVVRRWLPQRGALHDAWVGTLLADDPRRPRAPWLDVPRVESPRLPLRLRPFRDSDVPRHVEACTDPTTTHWLSGIATDYSETTARAGLVEAGEQAAAGTGMALAVADRDDDRLVARITVFGLEPLRAQAEIGYWVHPAERGRGVATEMVRLVARHALLPAEDGGLGLLRVVAHAAVANAASRAVLTGAGFAEVGVEHLGTRTADGPADAVLFEVLTAP